MEYLQEAWAATVDLVLETAPWLLLGLLVAGAVHRYLNARWIAGRLGPDAKYPVLLASLIGTPLPLCSCSVLPTAQALRNGGAGRGPTAAFLVATPETGPDSVGVTFGLFDPLFALLRPVMAWWSAIVVGKWVDATEEDSDPAIPGAAERTAHSTARGEFACHDHDHEQDHHHDPEGDPGPWTRTLAWILGPLWDDLAPALTLGFLIAGLFTAALPPDAIGAYVPAGLLGMAVVGLLGVPISICATASTPLAAALVDKGLSPGAALVLLLTGPATNLATLGVVRNLIGNKGLWAYLGGIFTAALGAGLLVDALYEATGRTLRRGVLQGEHTHEGIFVMACGALVGALFAAYWGRRALRILPSKSG